MESREVNAVPSEFSKIWPSICLLHFHCKISRANWVLSFPFFFSLLNGISSKSLVVAIHGKWFLCNDARMHKKEAESGQRNTPRIRQVKNMTALLHGYQRNGSVIFCRPVLQCISELPCLLELAVPLDPWKDRSSESRNHPKSFLPHYLQSCLDKPSTRWNGWLSPFPSLFCSIYFWFWKQKIACLFFFFFSFFLFAFSFPKCFISLPLLQWA